MRPNSLERMLKSLEGHIVDSVKLERKKGFLHVRLTVIELDPQYALHETLGGRLAYHSAPKDLSFSVMWKKNVEERMNKINSELGIVSEKLKKILEDRAAS